MGGFGIMNDDGECYGSRAPCVADSRLADERADTTMCCMVLSLLWVDGTGLLAGSLKIRFQPVIMSPLIPKQIKVTMLTRSANKELTTYDPRVRRCGETMLTQPSCP